ncbi:hypothetical protein ACLOJK_036485 [Asimina triloba]
MDSTDVKDRDLIDMESGDMASEEECSRDGSTWVGHTEAFLYRVWSRFISFEGLPNRKTCDNSFDSSDVCDECTGLLTGALGEARVDLAEKNVGTQTKEKPTKKSSKKPPKPPRPPTALLLDAADQKLVREISEVAVLKKARAERMKALKKMKDAKATTSSSITICAMAVTVIFCLVIILHGVFSRSDSHAQFQGSPEYALAAGEGFISVQYNSNLPARGTTGLGSGSPKYVASPCLIGIPHNLRTLYLSNFLQLMELILSMDFMLPEQTFAAAGTASWLGMFQMKNGSSSRLPKSQK